MATNAREPSIILIVDDDPSTLLLSAKPLEEAGYTVLTAPGSSEALRIHAEHPHPVNLVIADIFLPPPGFQLSVDSNPYPRVNGLEMIERLLEEKRAIRVILMSGSAGADLLSRGLIRDGLPFLRKPFTTEALLALVGQVLAGPPASADPKKSAPSGNSEIEWFD
ncbi:MAG: putative Response Regulator [Nitrospira sp.]|jgi:CheY-like chemotaxis protein|nr:putative Response Regulator [Nitrospira sp.]MCE3222547.1 putative Response Regulator [Nitrospira sp.]